MRVLFDQATPVPIRSVLDGHTVSTAAHEGRDRLGNGELPNAAEVAIVVLSRQQWPEVQPHVHLVAAAVNTRSLHRGGDSGRCLT